MSTNSLFITVICVLVGLIAWLSYGLWLYMKQHKNNVELNRINNDYINSLKRTIEFQSNIIKRQENTISESQKLEPLVYKPKSCKIKRGKMKICDFTGKKPKKIKVKETEIPGTFEVVIKKTKPKKERSKSDHGITLT